MPRQFLGAILLIGLTSACTTADAASASHGQPLASTIVVTPAPRVTPAVTPNSVHGAAWLSGKVVERRLPLLTVRTADEGDVTVDMSTARSIWRETAVDAAAIEIGDVLDVDGDRTFDGVRAVHAYANIGRLDGTIRSITDGVLEVACLRDPSATISARLSSYIVHEGPWHLADLHPGMTIGAVVYWGTRDGVRRITRIW